MFIQGRRSVLVLAVFGVLAFVIIEMSAANDRLEIGHTKGEGLETLRKFLFNVSEFFPGDRESLFQSELRPGKEFFSHTTGRMKEFGGPDFLSFVSLSNAEVTYLLNRKTRPRSLPSVDINGDPIDLKAAKAELIRVSESKARVIAIRFLETAIGETRLDRLCGGFKGLQDRGSHSLYRFTWTECADDHGTASHLSRIGVDLDPTSGFVLSYFNMTSNPVGLGENPVSLEEMESTAARASGINSVEIVRKTPFLYWHDDGLSEDACEIQYVARPDNGEEKTLTMVVSLTDYRILTEPRASTVSSGIWDTSFLRP